MRCTQQGIRRLRHQCQCALQIEFKWAWLVAQIGKGYMTTLLSSFKERWIYPAGLDIHVKLGGQLLYRNSHPYRALLIIFCICTASTVAVSWLVENYK